MALERIPSLPPLILPLTNNIIRPLWSVMVPAYNCSIYLRGTLQSILNQDKGVDNMQICVVDDCSTDENIAVLVQEIGGGRVEYFRQEQNVGSLRNFETCINRSSGKLVHLLHGDDQVLPGFYSEIEMLFNDYPSIGAAFTGLSAIDEKSQFLYHNNRIQSYSGIIEGWLTRIASNQLLRTCAIVVKRDVYEEMGGYYGVHYGEDWEMFVRIATKHPVGYSPKNLALYRIHEENISSRYLASAQNIKDTKKVIAIIQQYLPEEDRQRVKKESSRNFARYFTGNAHGIFRRHKNARVALKQAQGALMLSFNKGTFTSLIKLFLKTLLNYNGK